MNNQSSQLVSVLLLVLVLAGGWFVLRPMRDNTLELRADVDVQAAELQDLQAEYDELKALADEVSNSSAKKAALLKSVPVGKNQDELLLELTALAADLGMDTNAINFSLSADPATSDVLGLTSNFVGSYDDLIAFLQKLESADRLLEVTSISVQRTSTEDVVFNLNLQAFYQ